MEFDVDILEEEVIEVKCECGVVIITSIVQEVDCIIICPNCDKEHQLGKS